MKKLFVVRRLKDHKPLHYFDSKKEAKHFRDSLMEYDKPTAYVTLGPEHWRNK